jgi:hypothetical protein
LLKLSIGPRPDMIMMMLVLRPPHRPAPGAKGYVADDVLSSSGVSAYKTTLIQA